MGEPLVAATNETGSNLVTRWSVNPSANTWVTPAVNKSVILFSKPGAYTITANYFSDSTAPTPYDSSSSPVTVTDSVYNDSAVAHCNVIAEIPITAGDQITLTPISYSDTGLVLLAHTQDMYGDNYPSLGFSESGSIGGGYSFAFSNVTEYPCTTPASGPTPATGSLSFTGLSNGTYNLTISLNGANYQGMIVATDTDCTFSWNYSSGIIISPLQIQKQ
jgi:hypothetical protein